MADKADWKSVGDSLTRLADRLSAHASEGTDQVKAAAAGAETSADKAKVGAKAAVSKLDETTKDPEIGAALKDTTNSFLDALKVTLTGGDRATTAEPEGSTEPEAEPEMPKAVEPPQE
jgi:hypothetical protein